MRGLTTGLLAGITALSSASASFTCTFNISGDSGGAYSAYYQDLRDAISAAGDQWAQYIPASADLEIQITLVGGADFLGDSPVSIASIGNQGGFDIFQPGVEFELNGFADPNAGAADLNFQIGTSLLPQLWFDPDPAVRAAAVPDGKIDAISLFMRGFGRSLGFFSYRQADGSLGQGQAYQSSFDLNVISSGGAPFFIGVNAVALNGGPVALTNGAVYPLSGAFSGDVMSSAGVEPGVRYFVSALDLAILADSGLETLAIPEPCALTLLGGGAFALLAAARRSGRAV